MQQQVGGIQQTKYDLYLNRGMEPSLKGKAQSIDLLVKLVYISSFLKWKYYLPSLQNKLP
jgi:hypothetical protein